MYKSADAFFHHSNIAQLPSLVNMEWAVVMMVIGTILSSSLITPSAGNLSGLFPSDGLCGLSTNDRLEVQRRIKNAVPIANAGGVAVPECGPGPWLQIADFDINGPAQCPPEWQFVAMPASQAGCSQQDPDAGCTAATFSTGGIEYGKVCGRIIGAATGTPDTFFGSTPVDGIGLVDGLTITHSTPIQHIWTLAAAESDQTNDVVCPCKTNTRTVNMEAVDFAGENYFCDTTFEGTKLLWGSDCSIANTVLAECCEVNNPPFFTVTLPTRTSENVDAQLCRDQIQTNEDIRVRIIQLYVQ